MFQIDRDSFEPAYFQLKRQIVEKINLREYRPGDRIPSVRELARLTGLSCGTTAKVVNELVQETVVLKQKGIGNIVKDWQCRTIGITGAFQEKTFFNDHYYLGLMKGMYEVLAARDLAFTFKQVGEKLGQTFTHQAIDGLVIFGWGTIARFLPEIEELSKTRKILGVGGTFHEPFLNYVDSDNYESSFKSMELLIRKGHRDIAIFDSGKTARLRGCQDALQKYRLPFSENMVFYASGAEKAAELGRLRALRPTAIFSGSSFVAHKLLEDYLAEDRSRASRPALVSYDPLPELIGKHKLPHLYIAQPLEAIGRSAAENLIGLVEGTVTPPVRVNLPAELEVNW